MKILQVITRGDLGGAQTVLHTLVRGLRDRGHDVEVALGEPGPTSERLAGEGVTVHVVGDLGHGHARPADVKAVRALRRLIGDRAPDVVHCHSSKAGFVGRIAARLERVPSVYTAHGWPFQPGAPLLQRVASYTGEAVAGRVGSMVICVSEAEARLARSSHVVPRRRLVVVRNGVEDRPRRPEKAASTGSPVIVMVARFAMPKRQDVLAEALAGLTDLDWECRFVGSGPGQPEVQALVARLGLADRVRFTGDEANVAGVLDQSTVFVLLSDYEGQPISVIEAMRAGVPVVASDLPGTRELVGGGAGLLVENRPAAVAGALRAVLADPDRRRRLADAGRDRFEREHRAEQMVSAVEALYRGVVER